MILYFVIQLLATVLLGRYVSANIIIVAVSLVFLLPFLAVSVRRFHDLGLSGWCCLMTLIPFIGGFVQLIFMSFPSQLPDNKYGRNPNGFHPDKAWPVIAGWLAAVFAGAIL
jgi:uncharacterized membrane protein YhaH (DUF805 family)